MPYTTPPVCYLCGRVHPCDTNATIQLVNAKFVTVNVCKSHPGVVEEHNHQENMTIDEKAEQASKVIDTPEFKKMLGEYVEQLSIENPSQRDFIESIHKRFI